MADATLRDLDYTVAVLRQLAPDAPTTHNSDGLDSHARRRALLHTAAALERTAEEERARVPYRQEGWWVIQRLRTDAAPTAHYFQINGRSLCGTWTRSAHDRPMIQAPEAVRCIDCMSRRATAGDNG